MEKKRLLMDQDAIMRAIRRISHEILERNKGLSNALIVGIERRGVILAKRCRLKSNALKVFVLNVNHSMLLCIVMIVMLAKKRGNHVRLTQRRKQSFSWMMYFTQGVLFVQL